MWYVIYQEAFRTPRLMAVCRTEEKANEEAAYLAALGTRERNSRDSNGDIKFEMAWRRASQRYQLGNELIWVIQNDDK